MPSTTTVATLAALVALSAAQSSPTPTSTGAAPTSTVFALPFFIPFGQSIGGDVVSVDTGSASAATFAVTCLDNSCPGPKTATYTVGKSTMGFQWGSVANWNCPISGAKVACTLSADGETNTRTDNLGDLFPASATGGIADPVTISQGWDKAAPLFSASATPTSTSSSSSSSSSGSSSTSSPTSSSSSTTSSSASSSSASPSTTAGANTAERIVAGSGMLGAAALFVGAIVA